MNTALELIYHLSPYMVVGFGLIVVTMWFENKEPND